MSNLKIASFAATRYNYPMVDDSDMQALARRYLDLWERQLAASASDPAAARALSQWQALINAAGGERETDD